MTRKGSRLGGYKGRCLIGLEHPIHYTIRREIMQCLANVPRNERTRPTRWRRPSSRPFQERLGQFLPHHACPSRRSRSPLSLAKGPGAITATAHKLARIIYAMLKNQTEYRDPGQGFYEEQARQRAIKNLHRKAKKLGLIVVPVAA
jgi:hypothetical protein